MPTAERLASDRRFDAAGSCFALRNPGYPVFERPSRKLLKERAELTPLFVAYRARTFSLEFAAVAYEGVVKPPSLHSKPYQFRPAVSIGRAPNRKHVPFPWEQGKHIGWK